MRDGALGSKKMISEDVDRGCFQLFVGLLIRADELVPPPAAHALLCCVIHYRRQLLALVGAFRSLRKGTLTVVTRIPSPVPTGRLPLKTQGHSRRRADLHETLARLPSPETTVSIFCCSCAPRASLTRLTMALPSGNQSPVTGSLLDTSASSPDSDDVRNRGVEDFLGIAGRFGHSR